MNITSPGVDFNELELLVPPIQLKFIDKEFPLENMGFNLKLNSRRENKKQSKNNKKKKESLDMDSEVEETNEELEAFLSLNLDEMKQSLIEEFSLDKLFEIMKRELLKGYLTKYYNYNEDIFPGGLRGPYMETDVLPLGCGFYEVEFKLGKFDKSINDSRRKDKNTNRNFYSKFWIGYNLEEDFYYLIEKEETFNEKYEIIENAARTKPFNDLFYFCKKQTKMLCSSEHLNHLGLSKIEDNNGAFNEAFENVELLVRDIEVVLDAFKDYAYFLKIMEAIDEEDYINQLRSLEYIENSLQPHLLKNVKAIDRSDSVSIQKIKSFFIDAAQFKKNYLSPKYFIYLDENYIGYNFFALWDSLQLSKNKYFSDKTTEKQIKDATLEKAQEGKNRLYGYFEDIPVKVPKTKE